jgi:threonine dehydrogenase-like Zn-dependent dehydrogenase
VGRITQTGKHADQSLLNKLVFGFAPHATAFICNPSALIFAPASFQPETCSFLPNMETAVNLVQDAAPILGERVLVLGQGVVGLLVASLLKEFPLEELVTSDRYELRRQASHEIGVNDSFDPDGHGKKKEESGQPISERRYISNQLISESNPKPQFAYAQNFDLTFELSGSPAALNDAIAMTAFGGRIIIGSWYGNKRTPIDLGSTFHRSRIQLISSQVSTIAPALSGRWDKPRRFRVAWEALNRIQPQKWITHRFPIAKASEAYRLLDENPQETIQVMFSYS